MWWFGGICYICALKGGENVVACVHAIQPDSNVNLPVFLGFFLFL